VFALIAGALAWRLAESFFEGPRAAERAARTAELAAAAREHARLVERVREEAGPEGFASRKAKLAALRAGAERLIRDEQRELADVRAHAGRQASVRARFAPRFAAAEAELRSGADELRAFTAGAEGRARARASELYGAAVRVAQAHKNLTVL
jgi:hypothetical protein